MQGHRLVIRRHRQCRPVDGYADRAAGPLVVGVAVERPVGRAAGHVGEAGAEVQQAAQVLTFDARRRTRGSVRVAVIDARVAVHREAGIRLTDGDGYVAAGRLVVGVAVERPVGGAAGYAGEAGAQMQQAAQVLTLHAQCRTRGPVRIAVVHAAEAVDRDRGIRLTDGDGYVAAGRLVVGVAVERPVGRAAGYTGEAGAQMQQAAQVLTLHARCRTRGLVRIAVVHAAEAVDRDRGISLADGDRHVAAGR